MRLPYRLKRRSWQPARLRKVDHQALVLGLLLGAYVRGLDYLIGNDVWAARDFMLAFAPEWFWGAWFLTGAIILSAGVVLRTHLLVYLGHGLLWAAYTVNALALALGPPLPYLDGIRGAGATGLVALLHFVYLTRTGPSPLRAEDTNSSVSVSEHIIEGG